MGKTISFEPLCFVVLIPTNFIVSFAEIKGFQKGSSRHPVHYLQRGKVHRCSHKGNGGVCSRAWISPTSTSGWFPVTSHSPALLHQTIVAEHEIRNISCAAQDPDDLCTFAYITKDLNSGHHFCHVFSTVEVVSDTTPSSSSNRLDKASFVGSPASRGEKR